MLMHHNYNWNYRRIPEDFDESVQGKSKVRLYCCGKIQFHLGISSKEFERVLAEYGFQDTKKTKNQYFSLSWLMILH